MRRWRSGSPLVTSALAILLSAGVAAAQATVSGVVRDPRGRPVENAEVSLIGTKYVTHSDATGAFRLDSLPSGKFWLGARRLGYSPVAHAVTLEKGKARRFELAMDELPVTLSQVEVKARSGLSGRRYSDFERRRHTAWGTFITRDDIDRLRPARLGWLVQPHLPLLAPDAMDRSAWDMETERFMYGSRSAYSRSFPSRCSPLVSLNGGTPSPGWAVNDFDPDEVEAVEVYRGTATRLPIEFSMIRGAGCGVVVVWLR